jgi:serine/threonine-protein kinase
VIDASSEAAVPYLAMERLRGTTLAEILRKDPRLATPQVVELVRQIGAGIDAAASAGIVHRDLKPQNLFRHGDVWKILDFGVATLAEENTGTLTQGGIVGTPHYMAPEQAQAKRVDARADLYALAAIAYRCLTGRHAFSAPDTPALLFTVVNEMPARPGDSLDLHEDVDRWFALALAKLPEDRFPSGEAMTTALISAINGNLDPQLRRRADALLKAKGWSA